MGPVTIATVLRSAPPLVLGLSRLSSDVRHAYLLALKTAKSTILLRINIETILIRFNLAGPLRLGRPMLSGC